MSENNLKAEYFKFVVDFITTIRRTSFYPPKHPTVVAAIKNVHGLLVNILVVKNTMTMDISPDNKILIEGEPLDEKNAIIRENMQFLRKSNIENLTFSSGISEQELTDFIKIMLMDAAKIKAAGDIVKLLSDYGIQHVQTNQFSYIKVKQGEELVIGKPGEAEGGRSGAGSVDAAGTGEGNSGAVQAQTQAQAAASREIQEAQASLIEELKNKVKELSSGKIDKPEEIAGVEKAVFDLVASEFKPEKKVSTPTKTILNKLVSRYQDLGEGLGKLKNILLESGNSETDADEFVQKVKKDLLQKKEKVKKAGIKEEETKKLEEENEQLKEKLQQLQAKLEQSNKHPGVSGADTGFLEAGVGAGMGADAGMGAGTVAGGGAGIGGLPGDGGGKLSPEEEGKLVSENDNLKQRLVENSSLLGGVQEQLKGIEDEREKIDKIIHNVAGGLVVLDPDEKILMVNSLAETIMGISQDDLGKGIREVIKDEHLMTLLKKAGGAKDIEMYSPNEATAKMLRASSALIEDRNGKAIGMLTVLQDVAKQRQIDQEKLDFFAKATHELRSPLVAMDKSLGLIISKAAGPLSGDQEQFLSIIERNAKRLYSLINDLLDISKLEAGKLQLILEPADIEKVIDEPVQMFKTWAESKLIILEKKIAPGISKVNIDSNRIIQVINNLISNALKFTPEHGTITVEALMRNDSEIEVSIKDTGKGMPAEALPRLFEKFYQVQGTSSGEVKGTGLGLTVSKEIVELHGGKIWVESQVGVGTRFIFSLPLKDAAESLDTPA